MPMRPRSGSAIMLRQRKSWSSSCVDGCLNEVTSQPCGLTPSNTLLIADVLAGGVHALEDQQQRPAVLRVELFLEIVQPLAVGLDDLRRLVLVEAALLVGLVRLQVKLAGAVEAERRDIGLQFVGKRLRGFLAHFSAR